MDRIRRNILATGAAATAMAAAPRLFAQQTAQGGAAMSFYEKGPVRIHYEEAGSGFPLLLIAGGGLNSTMSGLTRGGPFNPIEEFKGEYRCIASDLRNANGGQSSGPLEIDRPWDAYTDDHLGLMDHLRIDKFMVLGFCIGGPFIWNLVKRAPARVVAPVPVLPDDVPSHPYAVAMECAMLAPKAEVSMFPWKEPKERIPLAVRQIRSLGSFQDRKSTRLNSS